MDEKIDHFISKPLYPYLYGYVFVIYKTSQYFPSFSLSGAINFLLLLSAACYLMDILLKHFYHNPYRGFCIVIFFASLLHVVTVAQFFGYPFSYIPTGFYIFFYLFIIIFISLVLVVSRRFRFSRMAMVNKVVNTFLIIASGVFLVNGLVFSARQKKILSSQGTKTGSFYTTKCKNDIVWILMDEYGSSASLQEDFSFHNPIDSTLSGMGFYVLNTMRSRYDNTLLSLNAVFNQDDSDKPANFYNGVQSLSNSSWVPLLEANGYRFINIGLFDIAASTKFSDRSGYPQTYLDQLLSGTAFSMLYMHFKYKPEKCDKYISQVVKKLQGELQDITSKPKFIWAHISIPHEPFCRNSRGELLPQKSYAESDTALIKKNYIEYLSYGNTVIKNLLKNCPRMSNKIIIISGDHGPRYSFLNNKSHRYWPFAAIKFPALPDTAGLQNLQYISQLPDFIMRYLSAVK